MTRISDLDPRANPFQEAFKKAKLKSEVPDYTAGPVEFAEASWGLGLTLFPVEKIVLKAFYGLPLDDIIPYVALRIYPKEETDKFLTEKQYVRLLKEEGRTNVDPDVPVKGKELVLVVGRRSMKTFISAVIDAYTVYELIMMKNPQERFKLPDGKEIALVNVAGGLAQAHILFKDVKNFVSRSPFLMEHVTNMTKTTISVQTPFDKQTGHEATISISCLPCSARTIRGEGTAIAIFDELAHFYKTGGPASDDAVYEALSPSTLTFTGFGKLISISSPLGEFGKLYDLFQAGVEGDRSFTCFRIPTWEANPTIPMDEFVNMHARNKLSFSAEFGADFVSAAGSAFIDKPELLAAAVDKGREIAERGNPSLTYYLGMDVGFGNDGFAMAICHPESSFLVVDYAKVFFAGVPPFEGRLVLNPEEMVGVVADLFRKFKISKGIMDQWESFSFQSLLQQRGISRVERVVFDRNLNSEIYTKFRNRLYQGGIRLPDDNPLLREIRTLRADQKEKYKIKVEAPSGMHDDLSDAVVRSLWLCERECFGDAEIVEGKTITARGVVSGRNMGNSRGSDAAFRRQVAHMRRYISHGKR